MKKFIAFILMAAALCLCLFSCGENAKIDKLPNYACIDIKDYGKIYVELAPDSAPETVRNFKSLVSNGFYDGLIFHRVIEGFMIQGGDPEGTGTGGSDKEITGEFSRNGHQNSLKHERGVISMARSGSNYEKYLNYGYQLKDLPADAQADVIRAFNSASSQFFIVHETSEHLDGSYAAFGRVLVGMDVVDAIASVDTNSSYKPLTDVVINSITLIEKSDIPA